MEVKKEVKETPHIVETYRNGTSWYRVYSNGWCEQGGVTASATSGTVSFIIPYASDDYRVFSNTIGDTDYYHFSASTASKSATGFTWKAYQGKHQRDWIALGYIA